MSIDIRPKNRMLNKSLKWLPAWHKADSCKIDSYQKHVSKEAFRLFDRNLECATHIDIICSNLTHLLHAVAFKTTPVSRYKPYLKPEWTPKLKQLHDMKRQKRRIWISEGRPRGMCHESYKEYRTISTLSKSSATSWISTKLPKCNVRLFWKLIKRQRPHSSCVCPEVEFGNMTFLTLLTQLTHSLNTLKTFTTQMTTTHTILTSTTTLKTLIYPWKLRT